MNYDALSKGSSPHITFRHLKFGVSDAFRKRFAPREGIVEAMTILVSFTGISILYSSTANFF
jgi:hypothetical protein